MTSEIKWLVVGILAVLVSGIYLIGANDPVHRIIWAILFGINCAAMPERIADAKRR